MDANKQELDALARGVIGAVYEVANTLGCGFLEKVYERALLKELTLRGLRCQSQASIPVFYKGAAVGDYSPDLLVEEKLIVELKCVEHFADEHVCSMYQLPSSFGPSSSAPDQFPTPKGRMEENCSRHLIRVHSRLNSRICYHQGTAPSSSLPG